MLWTNIARSGKAQRAVSRAAETLLTNVERVTTSKTMYVMTTVEAAAAYLPILPPVKKSAQNTRKATRMRVRLIQRRAEKVGFGWPQSADGLRRVSRSANLDCTSTS